MSGLVKVLSSVAPNMRDVKVPRTRLSFAAAVLAAGPCTPENSEIWKAGGVVPERDNAAGDELDIFLLNFPRVLSLMPCVVDMAQRCGLFPTSLYEVCAVAIHLPELYRELRTNPAGILATEEHCVEGVWRSCCVWLGSVQHEIAHVPSRYPLHDSYWFAFKPEPKGA